MARAISIGTVRLPKNLLEELYDVSTRMACVAGTLEVLLDKQTMRRIKLGQKQYAKRQYVVAKGPAEIRKALA